MPRKSLFIGDEIIVSKVQDTMTCLYPAGTAELPFRPVLCHADTGSTEGKRDCDALRILEKLSQLCQSNQLMASVIGLCSLRARG